MSVGSPMPRCASTLAQHVGRAEAGRADGDGDDDGCHEQQAEARGPRARAQAASPSSRAGDGAAASVTGLAVPASVAGRGRRPPLDPRRCVISSPSSPSWSTSDATAPTLRTPASVAGKSTTRYRCCCTAGSAAVAGFDSRCAIFCSAVFQAASTSTITSGSAATIASQPIDVHVSSTSAATFSRPAASMIICGAPMPAPT